MRFYDSVDEVEIENSSICNANCPQCLRESIPGNYTWFNQTYLPNEFFENKIPDSVYKKLKTILFVGTMGDPCAAPNFLDVIDIIKIKAPNARIQISTNGGMKTPSFWRQLGERLSSLGINHEVQFAIDGLEDTNHIYRVNVNWQKLMENVSAFISAGGRAHWQFIVFKHNQHQVEEAKEFGKTLGFKQFVTRPSHRFFLDNLLQVVRYGSDNTVLQPPTIDEYVHYIAAQDKENSSLQEWIQKSDNSCIECSAQVYKSVYIDVAGRIFPCCYLAASLYSRKGLELKVQDLWEDLWKDHGDRRINLNYNNWEEILNGSFYKEIQDRWNKSYKEGRLAVCSVTCSKTNNKISNPDDFSKFDRENYN